MFDNYGMSSKKTVYQSERLTHTIDPMRVVDQSERLTHTIDPMRVVDSLTYEHDRAVYFSHLSDLRSVVKQKPL